MSHNSLREPVVVVVVVVFFFWGGGGDCLEHPGSRGPVTYCRSGILTASLVLIPSRNLYQVMETDVSSGDFGFDDENPVTGLFFGYCKRYKNLPRILVT